ncbi:hypothetical protein RJG79_09900 [Mycoplasmatota bacterium WC44]
MNFLFKGVLVINMFFLLSVNVNATLIVSEELAEYMNEEIDYLVKDDFEIMVMEVIELSEYGKNVIFNDACRVDDGFIVVGGSVRMGDYLGGLDALVIKYKDNQIEWFKVFGGVRSDMFTTVHCGEDIVVGGETYEGNFKSGLMVSLDLDGNVNWEVSVSDKLDLSIKGVDYNGNYLFTGYINNLVTDNDFFVLEVNSLGEVINKKVFPYSGDDRINDILVSDYIYLVGSTDSFEFNVLSQRGLVIKLNEDISVLESDVFNSSNISLFNGIDLIDETLYISGSKVRNEAVELSESVGVLGKYNGELLVEEVKGFSEVNGVTKVGKELITYGVSIKKNYLPTINYKDNIILKGSGSVTSVVDSNGIIAIHTNNDSISSGVISSISNVLKENGNIYINGTLIQLEDRFIDEFNNEVFGEYKKYSYLNYNDIEYYGDLKVSEIEFYTNIEKSSYYDSVTLFFNGIGYINDIPIDSGYVVDEPGEYELKVVGMNKEGIRTFELKSSDFDGFKYYDLYESVEYTYVLSEKSYSLYIGVVILLALGGYWYYKK